jgi:hypothetical protein
MSTILFRCGVRTPACHVGAQADAWVAARRRRVETSLDAARTSAYATRIGMIIPSDSPNQALWRQSGVREDVIVGTVDV